MDVTKEKLGKFAMWGMIVFVVIWIGIGVYEKRGWKDDYTWEHRDFLNPEDREKGEGCILEQCVPTPTKENTRVEECICQGSNETVNVIYDIRMKVEIYDR